MCTWMRWEVIRWRTMVEAATDAYGNHSIEIHMKRHLEKDVTHKQAVIYSGY
jgi:hypothetical protein